MKRVLFPLFLLFFLSACSGQDRPPNSAQMKQAAGKTYLEINTEIQKIGDECRGKGGIIVNPILAMKCTSVCSFDPKDCKKLPLLEIEDFKKLACEKAVGQPGWICDYQYSVRSDSDLVMKMFQGVYGKETQAQARFFQTDGRQWVMAPMR